MVLEEVVRVRAKRRDVGGVRQTERDAVLMEVMAHQYGLPEDLLGSVLGVSVQSVMLRWKRAGWVRSGKVDAGATWFWLGQGQARECLGWDTPGWRPTPPVVGHVRAVAAVRFHRVGLDVGRWVSERTLQHQVGWRRKGERVRHVPDGVEVRPDGRRILTEVELTAKTRSRYLEPRPQDGSGDMAAGLLSDVEARARELGCMGVVYWCAPRILERVRDVVEEYVARTRERRGRARDPQALGPELRWAVRSLEEVPCWEPRRAAR